MDEIWDITSSTIPDNLQNVFIRPIFPTRRWNQITTKNATSDKHALGVAKSLITEKSRIKKDKEQSLRYKKKMYYLEVKE